MSSYGPSLGNKEANIHTYSTQNATHTTKKNIYKGRLLEIKDKQCIGSFKTELFMLFIIPHLWSVAR